MLDRLWYSLPFTGTPKPHVAVVRLTGVIAADRKSGSALNLEVIGKALRKAFSMSAAKAVVIVINSPGGSPAQSRMILDRIRALSAEQKKPVLTYIEDIGASGGYMLAIAGEEIFADPFAIVGSIGVITASFGMTEAMEKLGVERRVYTAGENKSQLDPFQPENPEDVARLENILTKSHDLFIERVKERRGQRLKGEESDLFSGNFWIAADAKALGLIDDTGDLHDLMKRRFGDDVELRKVDVEKKSAFLKMLGLQHKALLDPEALTETLMDRSHWARFGK